MRYLKSSYLKRLYSTANINTASKNSDQWKATSSIKNIAEQPFHSVTLQYLLKLEKYNLIEISRFMQIELPVRLAKRIKAIQDVPFIIGVNPYIKAVYDLYSNSFDVLSKFPFIENEDDAAKFTEALQKLTYNHREVIPLLAKGFAECGKYMSKEEGTKFLDGMIHARIGLRVLAEQYIAMQDLTPETGLVYTKLRPEKLIRSISTNVQDLCDINYGRSPSFIINGHIDTVFPYIPVHVEYIVTEVMKNAMRATVEHSIKLGRDEDPPVEITIANGMDDITFRIRDCGGGIPKHVLPYIFDYSFTTVEKEMEEDDGIFSRTSRENMQQAVGGPMAGLGFGLPMSRVYAKYFGGQLDIESITNFGCDTFIKLPNINLLASGVKI